MANSIYFINPKSDYPSYFSAEVYEGWGLTPTTANAELPLTLVASLIPNSFQVTLCDENITPIDYNTSSEVIGITGKISQSKNMVRIAKEFKKRNKMIIMGGPYASLSSEKLAPHCDILVVGEIEEIAQEIFSDIKNNIAKERYLGTRPSLDLSPIPRWDLYANPQARTGSIQVSRGCPFSCEFCDVTEYVGRKPRYKSIPNVLKELDYLYTFGYRTIFMADDNFAASRQRAKALLKAIRDWNLHLDKGKVMFSTQLSIDTAKDEELLRLCAEAGILWVFIGIETPNENSLKETKKNHNVGVDLKELIRRFLNYGIMVNAGMIVGFDSDDSSIFKKQYNFAMDLGVPIFSLGALVAPDATPLLKRLENENRIGSGNTITGIPWDTNILPKNFTKEELIEGLRWLSANLYEPKAFGSRVLQFINSIEERRDPFYRLSSNSNGVFQNKQLARDSQALLKTLYRMGSEEAKMITSLFEAVRKKPNTQMYAFISLMYYAQIRYMYKKHEFCL